MRERVGLKKTVVTGAGGFIGSHLVERLLVEDDIDTVVAFCEYSSDGRFGWLDALDRVEKHARLQLVLGDVRDSEQMATVIAEADAVFHLAALVSIPYSYVAPRAFVEVNALGTLNVLEATRRAGARLVHVSTSEVYGTPDTVPIDEGHSLKAQSPYSASKIAAEKLCEAYGLAFGVDVVVVRPFNTFGPRQSMRAVIPAILAQLDSQDGVVRLGNLDPRRDFTYVDDTVDGLMRAMRSDLSLGEVVQLGTGRAVSVRELVDLCASVIGVKPQIEVDKVRERPSTSEVETLLSAPIKARHTLGWEATISLEEGIRRTVHWMRNSGTKNAVWRFHT